MFKQNKFIAWSLVIIFAIFGIEKLNFITEETCDKKLMFCPTANMYVYTVLDTDNQNTNEQHTEQRTNKIINISCETFFINQVVTQQEINGTRFFNNNQYFFKPVIHSTPYITMIDPPPIYKRSLFFIT